VFEGLTDQAIFLLVEDVLEYRQPFKALLSLPFIQRSKLDKGVFTDADQEDGGYDEEVSNEPLKALVSGIGDISSPFKPRCGFF
jgi:hypothetical protein